MQHAKLGSLDALITRYRRRRTGLPDEGFVWKILYDCAVGLAHLQTGQDARTTREHALHGRDVPRKQDWNPVCHRDLKPSNILMTWKDCSDSCHYSTLLLGDFGCAVFSSTVLAGRAGPGTSC
jgi:serine/threonine protein kinase